ncbi:lysosomal alpha-glucosidase [Solea senegalensis]|uniref:Lysosomal alpha-glucosidase n=1 Tax=Solea senegalensis TaxID=28829 RepID=A0AAV6RN65_SOLSE|nr:lysosomal alpha-glucosidase [Solea senegalensis]
MAPQSRFDCARDRVLNKRQCEERGCCYAPLPNSVGPPWCFYPSLYPGYKLGPFTPSKRGLAATLTRAKPSYLPRDISTLRLEIIEETTGCLHLILKDPSSQRYEVKLAADDPKSRADNSDVLYTTEYQSDPFGFIVRRKSHDVIGCSKETKSIPVLRNQMGKVNTSHQVQKVLSPKTAQAYG